MRARRIVAGIGRAFIAAGVLILLFVAYELWGTNLAEARSQHSLRHEFEQSLRRSPPRSATTSTTGGASATSSTTGAPRPEAVPGEAVALIRIPKIGVDKAVVEGVGVPDLKKGPGHYPLTPMPGEPGNAAIAGHRTTYGAPFGNLDQLGPGDKIYVTTKARAEPFEYDVDHSLTVSPSDTGVLKPTSDNLLTLTTCTPRFTARQRLVIVARLAGQVVPPPPPDPGRPTPPPSAPVRAEGLSGGTEARLPAILWGALAALVWLVAWLVGRRWRRWAAYLIATPIFLIVLFVFFENVSRLLPANV